jgi:hypothetical protein
VSHCTYIIDIILSEVFLSIIDQCHRSRHRRQAMMGQ